MPLFGSNLSSKAISVKKEDNSVIKNDFRSDLKSRELSLDLRPLLVQLGEFEESVKRGRSIPATGRIRAAYRENVRLKRELEQLEKENIMLRLKFEILLDMNDRTAQGQNMQRSHGIGSLKQRNRKM